MHFWPITDTPFLYGVYCYTVDNIRVEVVRMDIGEWTMFLTRDGHVAACDIEHYRITKNRPGSYTDALGHARRFIKAMEAA